MFAIEPAPTSFDISFSFFGIPVRIHPLFFLLPVLWGSSSGDILLVLVYVLVFFVSILVHEMGHCLAMLSMGLRSRIVLYSMGGVAIPEGYGGYGRRSRLTTRDQIIISAAGPAAGFLLALLLIGIVRFMGGQAVVNWAYGFFPFVGLDFAGTGIASYVYLATLLQIAVTINVFLNLFNLLPVLPLDGGQIMREIVIFNNPWNGMQIALWTSVIVAALIAFVGFSSRETFLGIFFAYLAITNFQTLQMGGGPGGFGGGRNPW